MDTHTTSSHRHLHSWLSRCAAATVVVAAAWGLATPAVAGSASGTVSLSIRIEALPTTLRPMATVTAGSARATNAAFDAFLRGYGDRLEQRGLSGIRSDVVDSLRNDSVVWTQNETFVSSAPGTVWVATDSDDAGTISVL